MNETTPPPFDAPPDESLFNDEYSTAEPMDEPSDKPKKKPKAKKTTKSNIPKEFVYYTEQNPNYQGKTNDYDDDFYAIISNNPYKNHPERQLIMDTETTGTDERSGDRIVEIGMIEMVARKFTGNKLHIYLNPEREMDDEVIAIHGISNEFVSNKPIFSQVAEQVRAFCEGADLIAHNATFDMRFLDMEFVKAGYAPLSDVVQVIDSLAIARSMYRGQSNTLDALVKRLNVGKKDRTFHGALLDSEILGEVYLALTSGQVSLDIDDKKSDEVDLIIHEAMNDLASLLIKSKDGARDDIAWRKQVLK